MFAVVFDERQGRYQIVTLRTAKKFNFLVLITTTHSSRQAEQRLQELKKGINS